MIRLAILGVESSHTDSFVRQIAKREDVELTAISAESEELLSAFKAKFPDLKCKYVSPAELGEDADAILVNLRDGAKHLAAVKECAREGVSIWIDKPFAASVEDAEAMIDIFEKKGIAYSGGTMIRYTDAVLDMKPFYEENKDTLMSALLCFTVDINSPYSGLHFYAPHLIESAISVYGTGVKTVYSKLVGENLTVTLGYESFNVILNYAVAKTPYPYAAFAKGGSYVTTLTSQQYGAAEARLFDDILELAEKKVMKEGRDFFVTAVKVCCAIVDSIKEKKEISL